MDAVLRDNPGAHRYELHIDDQLAAVVEYSDRDGGRAIMHTEVGEDFEGRGLGSQLVRYVLDDARRQGRMILPYCSFVRDYIARHADDVDLVPAERRGRFNL